MDQFGRRRKRVGYEPYGKRQKRTNEWVPTATCKACRAELHRHANWARRFGMTPQDYEDMLQKQNGVCLLCDQPEPTRNKMLVVDHDHQTGKVRGLLCQRCNWALGIMETIMTPEWLKRAKAYVEQV